MWFNLFDSRKARGSRDTARRQAVNGGGRRAAAYRPRLEALEDRCLLSSYVLTDLSMLPGGYYSIPGDINAAGLVVGAAGTAQGAERAVLWKDGTVINLGTLGIDGFNGHSHAAAINDLGQIVGWSGVRAGTDLETHAFLLGAARLTA